LAEEEIIEKIGRAPEGQAVRYNLFRVLDTRLSGALELTGKGFSLPSFTQNNFP